MLHLHRLLSNVPDLYLSRPAQVRSRTAFGTAGFFVISNVPRSTCTPVMQLPWA